MNLRDVDILDQIRQHRLDQAMRRLAAIEHAWREARDRSHAAATALRDETKRALDAGELGSLARWLEPAERRLHQVWAAFDAVSHALIEARHEVDQARLGTEQVDALRTQLAATRKAARERRDIATGDALALRPRSADVAPEPVADMAC